MSPALLLSPETLAASTGGTTKVVTQQEDIQVIVHPLVMLSILDHHTRRQEGSSRVIGTLLGRKLTEKENTGDGSSGGDTNNSKTIIEITNTFAVPHAERGEEVAIGKDFNKQMLSLHLLGNRKEIVVGWYATQSDSGSDDGENNMSAGVVDTSSLIHEFYASEVDDGNPIHLVVDTSLSKNQLNMNAYISKPVILQGMPIANLFHQVRLMLKSSESEQICIYEMMKNQKRTLQRRIEGGGEVDSSSNKENDDDEEKLKVSMEKLLFLLEKVSNYVDHAVDNPSSDNVDEKVGRQISDAMSTVPRIRGEVFDKLFNDTLQDLLMVSYLSNITRTQLSIAEKLNSILTI